MILYTHLLVRDQPYVIISSEEPIARRDSSLRPVNCDQADDLWKRIDHASALIQFVPVTFVVCVWWSGCDINLRFINNAKSAYRKEKRRNQWVHYSVLASWSFFLTFPLSLLRPLLTLSVWAVMINSSQSAGSFRPLNRFKNIRSKR